MKHLLNHTKTTLTVGKYLDIPPGKYAALSPEEAGSHEVLYAIRAKWASLHDEPPAEIDFDTPKMDFVKPASMGNISLEEVKAEVAAKNGSVAEPEVVEEVAEEAEASVETEAAPKAPRRTKAK